MLHQSRLLPFFKYVHNGKFNSLVKECSFKRFLSITPKTLGVHASLNIQDNIGIVTLHSPGKVNVINLNVSKELEELFVEIDKNSDIIGTVLISDKPSCFIAGADINYLSSLKTAEEATRLSKYVQDFLFKIATSKKPFVAAIMGSCLGGGLEVALACHYRLAVDTKSVFSFPEVLLGLLPGSGGTQRLSTLIGLPNALDMTLTGKNIRSDKAKKMGLVDNLIPPLGPGLKKPDEQTLENLKDIAIQVSKDLAVGNLKMNRAPKGIYSILQQNLLKTKYIKDYVFKQARNKVMEETKGLYPAPLKILEVTRAGLGKVEKLGYEAEAKGFGDLVASDESKGLISLFNGQMECKRNKYGKSKDPVKSISILGAGLMGAGIADVSIRKGYTTILKDTTNDSISKGVSHIQNNIDLSHKKKKISRIEGEKYMSSLVTAIDYDKIANSDMVIEAVFEDIDLKRKVLREVENATSEDCIFATNTSALLVSDIAKESSRPDKVIGMHYFSPVDKMMLLEIVTTDATSEDTKRKAFEVGLKQGKVPIIVKDGPGFYTTRVIIPMIVEVYRLMTEGVDPLRIDKLSLDLGFPVGSVVLCDEVGIDIGYHVYCYFVEIFGERMKSVSLDLGKEVTNAGFLGRKSGKGAYIYNGSKKTINEEALKIIERFHQEPKMPLTDDNIKFRILSRFVNEAILCLQEGVLSNPLEGDIGAVFGLGFPPFTGGPFHFMDTYGAAKFMNKMREFEANYGPNFTPCQLLVDHAKDSSKRFFPSN